MERYPYQLSGGMQQRVVIAMALACDPQLLVLDEPTTGLDATVEAEVLDLVRGLREESGAAILLIAHNLGVIRDMCDRVGVMYAGKLVEEGPSEQVFDDPRHPYTVGLLRCLPRHGAHKATRRLDTIPGFLPQIGTPLPACVYVDRCPLATEVCRDVPPPRCRWAPGRFSLCHHVDRIPTIPTTSAASTAAGPVAGEPVLSMRGLSKTFRQSGQDIHALVDIDSSSPPARRSGSSASPARARPRSPRRSSASTPPTPGSVVVLDGETLAGLAGRRPQSVKRAIQIIFQNPDSALNRSHSVRRILSRALRKLAGAPPDAADERLTALAEQVRLTSRHFDMKPGSSRAG
jgi:peptide/nickel transport system ATP-binding protein